MKTTYANITMYFILLATVTASAILEKNPLAKASLMVFLGFLVLPVIHGFYKWFTGKPGNPNKVDVAAYFEAHETPHIHYKLDIVFHGIDGKDHELELIYCPLTRKTIQLNPAPTQINCTSYKRDFDEKSSHYGE